MAATTQTIPLFKVFMSEDIDQPLLQTVKSGFIGQGPRVEEFEEALRPWVGRKNILTLNSGTSAIHLAFHMAGVGPGDEVISTAMTCTATNEPILALGAKIVWADIDPWTGNISPESVEKKITSKTKAIIIVHWGGYPSDIEELNRIAKLHNIPVIEDAAHAFGAVYKNAKVGSHSDFVCFSFQAIKHMTCGDGGLLTCGSQASYRRGKLLRWYGIDRESPRKDFRCEEDIVEFGYKFHMNDISATIGTVNLKKADWVIGRHRKNAEYFRQHLKHADISLLKYATDRTSSYWLFTLRHRRRDLFMKYMAENGIAVSQVHARNDTHTMMKAFRADLPGVDEFCREQVSIPVGWWLTDKDVEHIVKTANAF